MTVSHPVTYSRFLDRESRSLARAGYDVTLVGLGDGSPRSGPDGINLVPIAPRHGPAKLALVHALGRMVRRLRVDVCHCLDPWSLLCGLWLRRSGLPARLVYEASELFAQTYADRTDLPKLTRWLASGLVARLERAACLSYDMIIDTNRTRAARFEQLGRRPVLVPNYPPQELLREPTPGVRPWVAWTGLASRPRGFHVLLQALAETARQHSDIELHVCGEFDPRDDIGAWSAEFISKHGLERNVRLHGYLPYVDMFDLLADCCCGVILLQPGRANDFTGQPNKLFEFMGSGLAVIASDFPEMSWVVRAHDCGWVVNPEDSLQVAAALRAALEDPAATHQRGLAGRDAVFARYTWRHAEQELLAAYGSMLA
jgi:glycosyltransferase involved in cell wall biosynthesis